MADSGEKGNEDATNQDKTNSTSSVMEVDPPPVVEKDTMDLDKGDDSITEKGNKNDASTGEKTGDDDFLVLEEDDGNEEETEKETFKTPEPEPMDAASLLLENGEKVREGLQAVKVKDEDGVKGDDDLLLVNPLFGKNNAVPVIDIESSSSSSDEESDEDFSLDVTVNNFVKPSRDGDPVDTVEDGNAKEVPAGELPLPQRPRTNRQGCNCDCYHEKGILVNEIERLRKAVFELSERHSVLEDFIEVEYSESFGKFLKNREHLVSMGFGGKDSEGCEDIIDGKRSSKSAELIELLKMIKEQADAKGKEESDKKTSSTTSTKAGAGSTSTNQSHKSQTKTKSIPSITSQRERGDRGARGSGRGGALSYNQRSSIGPDPAADMYALQYQQHYLAHQQAQQGAQARSYYDSMYGPVVDRRDYISAVGRTELYPSSSNSYGYGYGGRSDSGSTKESKKQRKRKRQSDLSSETSSAGAAGSSKGILNGGKGQQRNASTNKAAAVAKTEEVEVIEYTKEELNVNTKRICPLCEKIVARKSLRDHLSIVHQGHKVACPVCQVEFFQRKRIKTHMRDAHDLPASEYSAYIEKIYSNIEEQCGPWLDKLMKEAETPTKDQLLVHNAEIQMYLLSKRDQKTASSGGKDVGTVSSTTMKPIASTSRNSASSSSKPIHSSSSSGGQRDNRDRDRNTKDKSSRGGSSSFHSSNSQQSVRYFTGANTKVSSKGHSSGRDIPSADLYPPGGYAQYAARYLQQRAATGTGAYLQQRF